MNQTAATATLHIRFIFGTGSRKERDDFKDRAMATFAVFGRIAEFSLSAHPKPSGAEIFTVSVVADGRPEILRNALVARLGEPAGWKMTDGSGEAEALWPADERSRPFSTIVTAAHIQVKRRS